MAYGEVHHRNLFALVEQTTLFVLRDISMQLKRVLFERFYSSLYHKVDYFITMSGIGLLFSDD